VCVLLDCGIIRFARQGRIPPKWITIPVELLVGAGFLFFIVVEAFIIRGTNGELPECADYLIVLGAKVNGTQPSLILKYRIQAAAEYLQAHPDTLVIASGGKGTDEGISEAECIYQGLVELGIAQERILIEDNSTNTSENLTYSAAIIRSRRDSGEAEDEISETVILTTTDFHVYRATKLAQRKGYLQVYGNPARSVWWLIPTNYTREFFAVLKDIIL
jgi:uncharacterized SAM-binding protein YcdF (DUF218 family)